MTGTLFFVGLSPFLIAYFRRADWPESLVTLVSILVVAICYAIGQAFDTRLAWPLTVDFWEGLAASYGSQQVLYRLVLKNTEPIESMKRYKE